MAFWHSYQYVEYDKCVYTLVAPYKQVYNALIVISYSYAYAT